MPAYCHTTIGELLETDDDQIVGCLVNGYRADRFAQLQTAQTDSWYSQLAILRSAFNSAQPLVADLYHWHLLFEYTIPRCGKRADLVLLAGGALAVGEFKIGADSFDAADIRQTIGYCLDLQDFHEQSRELPIFPFLIASQAPDSRTSGVCMASSSGIQPTAKTNASRLAHTLKELSETTAYKSRCIDPYVWENSRYFPTPTIIEAAQTLYGEHDVRDILHSHADEANLARTAVAIEKAIHDAQENRKRIICFITGVPGSGKTLAGLNIAHNPALKEDSLTYFTSGNGPLVKVLSEALVRDELRKGTMTRQQAEQKVSAFIRNIHGYIRTYIDQRPDEDPPDRVIIFDEAQRAWDAKQNMRKWKRDRSEPSLILEALSRAEGWRVLVALIGSGQEIHDGEAGLPEWGRVLVEERTDWEVRISPELATGEQHAGNLPLFSEKPQGLAVLNESDLHLSVSRRAYKAEKVSEWVALVLDGDEVAAQAIYQEIHEYPIALTRSLDCAKRWLRERTLGGRRCGLIASSGARRLRAHGVDVTCELPVAEWFLNPPEDVRSSSFLELPATEFAVQGLELDWSCVCWGADFRWGSGDWSYHRFRGTRWENVSGSRLDRRRFILNKYRVLLTRARQGMVIWVPEGDPEDPTRPPAHYDSTAAYLAGCGCTSID